MDHSGTRRNLEVDFFGGEPLMNWDVVKQPGGLRPQRGEGAGQELPLYPHHQRHAHRRRRHRLCQPGDEQRGAELWTAARKSTTAPGWTTRATAATSASCPSSRSWCGPGREELLHAGYLHPRQPGLHQGPVPHGGDLGFTELSMEPVVCAPDDPAALTQEDIEIVKEQYEILAKDMLRREKRATPSPSTTTCWT